LFLFLSSFYALFGVKTVYPRAGLGAFLETSTPKQKAWQQVFSLFLCGFPPRTAYEVPAKSAWAKDWRAVNRASFYGLLPDNAAWYWNTAPDASGVGAFGSRV
jgi:hypothetical protein